MTCDNCGKEDNYINKNYRFKTVGLRSKEPLRELYSGDKSYMTIQFTPEYCINCLRDALNALEERKNAN